MPVMRVELAIGAYDDRSSADFPGFVDRLTAWLPGLAAHECSVGRPGGFVERLRRGTYLPHILEHVTLELQGEMGFDVTFGRARGAGERGVYAVVIAYSAEEPSRQAFEAALRLTLAAMHDRPFDRDAELARLRRLADEHRPDPASDEALAGAARRTRLPTMAVTGTNGKTTVTRLLAHVHAAAGKVVGMTCTDGTYVEGERIMRGDCSGPKSARAVLLHPRTEVAVLETARGGILREGLAFDRCSVAVVTNVSADHLGVGGVETIEDLAKVKQVVVESVARDGVAVLNAEDPRVAEMAAATRARVVYFAKSRDHAVMAAHLAEGGWGVYVRDGRVVVDDGAATALVALERVPFTAGGKIAFQIENALAATAAAWASGVSPALIAGALTTFRTDAATTPGRFNRLEIAGVEVVVDYGHNPAALAALGGGIRALGRRRTVLAIGLPGDRRDEDIYASIRATRPYADEYVLYDAPDRRGRALGEVPRLMRAALRGEAPAALAGDQAEGIAAAWRLVEPGERVVLVPEDVEAALEQIRGLGMSAAIGRVA